LDAGIQLGRNGEKVHPFTESLSRNLLGKKINTPYDAGLAIGNRMQPMDPERQERFLNKTIGMGAARKQSLLDQGKKVKDPVLNAIDAWQIGKDRHHETFQSLLTKGGIPQDEKRNLAALGGHALSAVAAPLDSRVIARPAVRKVESLPAVQEIKSRLFPMGTIREKGYNFVRDQID
jgi:hypothetical protein